MALTLQTKALSGAQKAAVLLLSLGENGAAPLLTMLHEEEVRDISAAMAQLGAIPAEIVERLCSEFIDNIGVAGKLIGGFETTERLLQTSLPPERVAQIMEEIRGPAGRPPLSG